MIFLISDIHADKKTFDARVADVERRYGHKLDANDLIVCAGDLLGNYKDKKRCKGVSLAAADRRFLKWLSTQPYQVVSVFGNHDTLWRIRKQLGVQFVERYGNTVAQVSNNVAYLLNGEVYQLSDPCEETHIEILAAGGAFPHTYRLHTRSYMSSHKFWKQYSKLLGQYGDYRGGEFTQFRRNMDKQHEAESEYNREYGYVEDFFSDSHGSLMELSEEGLFIPPQETLCVDYVISHEAPSSKMGKLTRFLYGRTPASDVMEAIYHVTDFRHWYFGHHHWDYEPASGFTCLYRKTAKLVSSDAGEEISDVNEKEPTE